MGLGLMQPLPVSDSLRNRNVPAAQTVAQRPFAPKCFSRSRPAVETLRREREQIGPQVIFSSRFPFRFAPFPNRHKQVFLPRLQSAQVVAQPGIQSAAAHRTGKHVSRAICRLNQGAVVRGPRRDFKFHVGPQTPIAAQNLGAKSRPFALASNVFIAEQAHQGVFLDEPGGQSAPHLMPQQSRGGQDGLTLSQQRAFIEQQDSYARLARDERLENRVQYLAARIVALDFAFKPELSANRREGRFQLPLILDSYQARPIGKRLVERRRRRPIEASVEKLHLGDFSFCCKLGVQTDL